MPTYEFLCAGCNKVFELTCSLADYEKQKKQGIKCEACGSRKVTRNISQFQVQTSKKS